MMKLIKDKNFQFGIIFSIIFLILGIYFYSYRNLKFIFISISIIFFVISFYKPIGLQKLASLWIKFGFFLGKIISPIFLFIIFFFLVTPIGIMLQIFKKDVLLLKMNKKQKTYWINKISTISNMRDQF